MGSPLSIGGEHARLRVQPETAMLSSESTRCHRHGHHEAFLQPSKGLPSMRPSLPSAYPSCGNVWCSQGLEGGGGLNEDARKYGTAKEEKVCNFW